jgi:hypothetical protein
MIPLRQSLIVSTCLIVIAGSAPLGADVRTDERTRVELGGMLGRMANVFGGRAAREGVTSTVAVKGNRKVTLSDNSGQIGGLVGGPARRTAQERVQGDVTPLAMVMKTTNEVLKIATEVTAAEVAIPAGFKEQ